MASFDVISKISYPEFDNALANCLKEISNRFDFKGLDISIERKDKIITTLAPDELKLKQVNELLQVHLIRRKVDPRVVAIKNSLKKKIEIKYFARNFEENPEPLIDVLKLFEFLDGKNIFSKKNNEKVNLMTCSSNSYVDNCLIKLNENPRFFLKV